MAQAWIFESLSPSKPSLSHGFQAELSHYNAMSDSDEGQARGKNNDEDAGDDADKVK